jgi:tetrapyrrole methylase family protein / MazG family protein
MRLEKGDQEKGGKVQLAEIRKRSKIKSDSPLSRAYDLTKRAARLGFDWPDIEGVLKKMDEEIEELREALSLQNRKRIREEIGDLLFAMVNIARFLRINPEEALKTTMEKFSSRFRYIEASLRKEGRSLRHSNIIEMDRLWEEAKRKKRVALKEKIPPR